MLQTDEVGRFFSIMQANYGSRWLHKADAIPVWQEKLKHYAASDVMAAASKAIDFYTDWPPTIGQFIEVLSDSTPKLPSPDGTTFEDLARAERIYQYTKPESNRNPNGNPHGIKLPEDAAQRQPAKSVDRYEKRIAAEVTFAMYPHMRRAYQDLR